ncbi:MAG: 3-dehydroquinate synthase, partial [Paludibacteraceae bacterium]|nr:3-dehydroquinate synthase [Paludibacteraceae bacterium]
MICTDIHTALESLLARYDHDQVVIVCDKAIDQLPITNYHYPTLPLAVSEAEKSIEAVSRIWDFLLEHGITRRGVVVCIGGGVLTDIGGFVAATYKRGIDYINVPTTLLAMIDSSSGGKTGVNYRGLKNCIGVFAPPVETVIWPEWLKTLPAKQKLSGFGEMLKTGLIEPSEVSIQNSDFLWDRLLRYDLDTMDIAALTPLIEECVAVKERIVKADPREEGLRKVLNFGHTFGHALEEMSLTGAAGLLHGYAVLYGLIAELYLSVVKLNCPKEPL